MSAPGPTEIDDLTIGLVQQLNGKIMPVEIRSSLPFLSTAPPLHELLKFMNRRGDLDQGVRVSPRRIASALARARKFT